MITGIALGAMLAMMVPAAALAHNGPGKMTDKNFIGPAISVFEDNDNSGSGRGSKIFRRLDDREARDHEKRFSTGTVTAVGSNSLTLKSGKGTIYTVNTADAKITLAFGAAISLSDVKVNDHAMVRGSVAATTNSASSDTKLINATSIVIVPANTRPAAVKGTVTAKTDNTITLQTKHDDTVTVQTDDNTTVTQEDGSVGATSDIEVGAEVKVKGLWDKVLDVFRAIKIRFK